MSYLLQGKQVFLCVWKLQGLSNSSKTITLLNGIAGIATLALNSES